MKINLWRYLAIFSLLLFGTLSLTSCVSSSTTASEYYNAGNANLSITGAQLDQYYLFRFDTSTSALTMALPSAADIVANLQSPYVGEVIDVAVAADGVNSVTLIAGTNVTIKTSASVVPGNTTATMYCELDNITSGTEAVTLY
ncbi:MAG: hypothetical protein ABR924_15785 [Terracidiphilus sp.]|jgi:hypothetical protein